MRKLLIALLIVLLASVAGAEISQLQVTACGGGLGEPCGETVVTVKRGQEVTFRIMARQFSAFDRDEEHGQVRVNLNGDPDLIVKGCYVEEAAPQGFVTEELFVNCDDGDFIRINPYDGTGFPPIYDPLLLRVGENREMLQLTVRVPVNATPGLKRVTAGWVEFIALASVITEPILFGPFVFVPEWKCQNGLDDDLDGKIDYPDDKGCQSPTGASELPDCGDGFDNDLDGFTDMADLNCNNGGQTFEHTAEDDEPEPCGLLGIEAVLLIGLLVGAQRIMRQRF